ncbi:MAG: SMC-Scp complex subunit ScpB [Gammaproteobacteria bacterium]|nr:SMC-Scp complex subunit ScpB [Gammaproteobacteria bacterium]
MSEIGLVQIIEGALLAAGKPLTVAQLGELFEDNERPDNAALRAALDEVSGRCEGRGFELQEVASGFRFQVRQSLSPWVARLWHERPQKYSRALLETLALIAYRQPITRGEIEEIRGVAVSSNIIKTLHEREWIRVVGHRDVPGRPAMYATTRQFLDYFNLKTLDQLPALADIRDLETLNAELGFSDPVSATDTAGGGRGLTLVGGTDHARADAAVDAAGEPGTGDDAAEPRETTAMDLAVTAADLVQDEAPAQAADDGEPVEDEPGADATDSAAAGPDSRA